MLRSATSLQTGKYLLSYRVTSADGHPVAGAFLFQVGAGAAESAALAGLQAAAEQDTWRGPVLAVRSVLYLALLLGAGGTLATIMLRPSPAVVTASRRIALVACCAATLLLLPFHLLVAAQLLGASGKDWLGMATWRLVVAGPHAANLAMTAAGLLILLFGLAGRRSWIPMWSIAGSLAVAAAFTLAGHAASAEPHWLVRGVLFLHVLCAAFWIGALPLLLISVLRLGADAARC